MTAAWSCSRLPLIPVAAFALVASATPVFAGVEIGDVQLVKQDAFGTPPDEDKRALKAQLPVFENENVETARDSAAHLHFKDDTILRVGSGSKVKLDHMVYDPNRGTGELAFTLSQGAFRYISGKIKNEKVSIKTPTATIGVRGTDITVLIFKDGSTQLIVNDNSQASIQSVVGGPAVQIKKGEQGTVVRNQSGATVGAAPPFGSAFTPDSGLLDSAGIGSPDKTTATATQSIIFPDLASAANSSNYKNDPPPVQPPTTPPASAGQVTCNSPCGVPSSFGTSSHDTNLSQLPLGPGGHGHHGRLGAWTSPWGGGFRFAGGMSAFGQLMHALLHDGLEAGLATALGGLPPPNPANQFASLNSGVLNDAGGTRATDAVANTAANAAAAAAAGGVASQVAQTIGSVFAPFFIQIRWGVGGHDLDLHLTGPNGAARFQVYYANPNPAGANAHLNADCVCTAGSEVITVSQFNQGGTYRTSVFNFGNQSTSPTNTNLSTGSGVTMTFIQGGTVGPGQNGGSIVNGGTTVGTLTPTTGQAGNTWIAAEINPASGKVTPVNTLTNTSNCGTQC